MRVSIQFKPKKTCFQRQGDLVEQYGDIEAKQPDRQSTEAAKNLPDSFLGRQTALATKIEHCSTIKRPKKT